MQELVTCANSGRGWAAARAAMAIQIGEALQQGAIAPDEARELLQDLIRTDQLDAEADDIELKTLLVTGVWAILKVI